MNEQLEANIKRLDEVIANHRAANKSMDDSLIQFLRDQLVSSWRFTANLTMLPKSQAE